MSNPRNTLASNLSAFRQEWSKARRHMLAGKQRNITTGVSAPAATPSVRPARPPEQATQNSSGNTRNHSSSRPQRSNVSLG